MTGQPAGGTGGDRTRGSLTNPAGLVVVAAITILVAAAVWSGLGVGTVVGAVLVVPFLLLAPGYALLAATVPRSVPFDRYGRTDPASPDAPGGGDDPTSSVVDRLADGLDPLERLVVSFALSIVVVPLIGYAIDLLGGAVRPVPVVLTVSVVTLLASAVALGRWRRATDERVLAWTKRWASGLRPTRPSDVSRKNVVLLVVVLSAVVFAGGSVLTIATTPEDGFTEFYLGNASEPTDRAMASFSAPVEAGAPFPARLTVANHEHERTTYTVVAVQQRVDDTGAVVAQTELRRDSTTVDAGQTWTTQYDVTPTRSGERVRLQYLLYVGDAPATPSAESAEYDLHVWLSNDTGQS